MVYFVNSGRIVNKFINFNTEIHLFRHLKFLIIFNWEKITFFWIDLLNIYIDHQVDMQYHINRGSHGYTTMAHIKARKSANFKFRGFSNTLFNSAVCLAHRILALVR